MKRILGTPIKDYLPAIFVAVIAVVYLVTGYGYSPAAREMPVSVAWLVLLFSVLDFASRSNTLFGALLIRTLNPAAESHNQAHYPLAKELAAVAWVIVLIVLMETIGILYAVFVFVLLSIRIRGRRPLWLSALVAAAAAAMTWLLFDLILQLELYPGFLFAS